MPDAGLSIFISDKIIIFLKTDEEGKINKSIWRYHVYIEVKLATLIVYYIIFIYLYSMNLNYPTLKLCIYNKLNHYSLIKHNELTCFIN